MWRTKVLLGLAKVLCINYAVTEWVVTGSTIAVDCTDTAVGHTWPDPLFLFEWRVILSHKAEEIS